jgi:L-Ala-D/L-Glu epimerase / N-acetyl-D-glutamate racemase
MASCRLNIRLKTLPLKAPFRISRGAKHEAREIRVAIAEGALLGEGACIPYARYGESVESVLETLDAVRAEIENGLGVEALQERLPPGSARNALDCALWDLRARKQGKSVGALVEMEPGEEFSTLRTVVLDDPPAMAASAASFADGTPLKIKLGRARVLETLEVVHRAAPKSPLVVDPNEGWDGRTLAEAWPELKGLGVILLEQPLPAGADDALKEHPHPVPVCADEACRGVADLPRLKRAYDAVNIKLDKTGGFTAALELYHAAKGEGLGVMLGCLVGSALAVAPLAVLAAAADYVDLDGPLLLANGAGDGMEEIPGTNRVRFNHCWGRS